MTPIVIPLRHFYISFSHAFNLGVLIYFHSLRNPCRHSKAGKAEAYNLNGERERERKERERERQDG